MLSTKSTRYLQLTAAIQQSLGHGFTPQTSTLPLTFIVGPNLAITSQVAFEGSVIGHEGRVFIWQMIQFSMSVLA